MSYLLWPKNAFFNTVIEQILHFFNTIPVSSICKFMKISWFVLLGKKVQL